MAEDMPEVIGWELEEAKDKLSSGGWRVQVTETFPPKHKLIGPLRVVRQRLMQGGEVELVAAASSQLSNSDAKDSSALKTASATPLTADDLIAQIDPTRVPRHVAIIMDGNGRWAKERGLPRILGHRAGHEAVKRVVEHAPDLGISFITLYTFSAENWRRPAEEVNALMELIGSVLELELPGLKEQGVRVRALGRLEGLPEALRASFRKAYEETCENRRLTLNIAINYSGRWEIVDAARRLAERVRRGEITPEEIDEESFAAALYQPDTPDPELLIRTSGEMRISNYLLWQIAYTELHVTPVLWPDFDKIHLVEAVLDYQQRQRRFGAVSPEKR